MKTLYKFIDWLRYPAMFIIAGVAICIYFSMEWLDKFIENLGA